MVLDPQKGKEAIAPEPTSWCVSSYEDFNDWVNGGTPIPERFRSPSLEQALADAKRWSSQNYEAHYVFCHPHPEGSRNAIAVAIGGEIYKKVNSPYGQALPSLNTAQWLEILVHTIPNRRELFAAMAMQGMLAGDMLQEWERDELAGMSIDAADALIAAFARGQ